MATADVLERGPAGLLLTLSRLMAAFMVPARQDGDGPPVRLRSDEQRSAADRILASTGPEDLLDALDGEVHSFVSQIKTPPPSVSAEARERSIKHIENESLDMPSLRRTLGDSAAEKCQEGFTVFKAVLRQAVTASAAASAAADLQAEPKKAPVPVPATLEDILLDDRFPLAFRKGLLCVSRSFSAMYAIARAEEFGKRLDTWLALALADAYAAGPFLIRDTLLALQRDPNFGKKLGADFERQGRLQSRKNAWVASMPAGASFHYPLGQADD